MIKKLVLILSVIVAFMVIGCSADGKSGGGATTTTTTTTTNNNLLPLPVEAEGHWSYSGSAYFYVSDSSLFRFPNGTAFESVKYNKTTNKVVYSSNDSDTGYSWNGTAFTRDDVANVTLKKRANSIGDKGRPLLPVAANGEWVGAQQITGKVLIRDGKIGVNNIGTELSDVGTYDKTTQKIYISGGESAYSWNGTAVLLGTEVFKK